MAEVMEPAPGEDRNRQAEGDGNQCLGCSSRAITTRREARHVVTERVDQEHSGAEHPEQWGDAGDGLKARTAAAEFAVKNGGGPVRGASRAVNRAHVERIGHGSDWTPMVSISSQAPQLPEGISA